MIMYGAVRLAAPVESREGVESYYRELSQLHGLVIEAGAPPDSYLEPEIRDLWPKSDWLRFSLHGETQEFASDSMLMKAGFHGDAILARDRGRLSPENVWPRVPQWRCLNFMFWHEFIWDAYIVIEHTSGDSALVADIRRVSLTEALRDLWLNYSWTQHTEDPAIYSIDLARLPL